MSKVNFYELNEIEDDRLAFAVIAARYKNKWIFVKHKKRDTWEIPGGHREKNEAIGETAERELFEETGAKRFKVIPVCVYAVERGNDEKINYTESFGGLFYAEVEEIGKLPEYEIGKIELFDDVPEELTYPLIQPFLHNKVVEFTKE